MGINGTIANALTSRKWLLWMQMRRLRTKCMGLHTVGVAVNEAKRTLTSLVVFLSLPDWRLCSCPSVILGVPTSTNSTRLKVQSLRASLTRHFAVSSLVGFTSATDERCY